MQPIVTDRVAWSVCRSVSIASPVKRLNRSRCRLECGLGWAHDTCIYSVVPPLIIVTRKPHSRSHRRTDHFSNIFGRPFVKRFALCYRTIVLSVCLSCLRRWCIVAKQLPPKGHSPNFRHMSVVAKRLDGSRCHLARV